MKTNSHIVYFILACLFFVSCAEAENVTIMIEKAELEGTFQRISGDNSGPEAEVTIMVNEGRWEGNSSKSRYPALCKGSYTTKDNTITFENECMWTADFDWTLILSGTFEVILTDQHMIWEKRSGSGSEQVIDRYTFPKSDQEKLIF